MTHRSNILPCDSTTCLANDSGVVLANRLASEVRTRWLHGERPDVAAVLADHPELKRYKSIVLDLALDEYCFRQESGELLDADEFSRGFPTLQRSLFMLIEVEKLLDQASDFRTLQEGVSWPEPGETFLGFSLIAELGRGTFGRVFLASEPALGDRLVAIKVALQGGQEAETLGKLQHPNIVPVYSVREDAATGLTAVCMPYLGRATLCDVRDRSFAGLGPPAHSRVILDLVRDFSDDLDAVDSSSFDRVLRRGSYVDGIIHLAVQLADALEYTHSRGICHRDLKPSNVLLSVAGRPLLLDFNLSSDMQVCVSKIGGTLPYMAPEQLRCAVLESPEHQTRVDPRSDLFSLGVILYELLCGSLPFGEISWGLSIQEIAENLLQQQKKGPEPLRAKNKQVDRALAQLIEEALAFDPECRPESARAMKTAFRKQVTLARRSKRWVRNHRRRVSLLTASLSVLVLTAISFFVLRDPYHVRQCDRGLEYYGQRKYELAVDCFDQAVRSDPSYGEALFARGRAYQELGKFQWAFDDFDAAFRVAPSPELAACKGYCLSKARHHEAAIDSYRNALNMGHDPAVLLNNIGFSYIQLRRLDEAEDCLKKAVEADESLQAAHHNLVIVCFNRALDGRPVPASALVHAERAIDIGPKTADLYYRIATLYALAARVRPDLAQQATGYLKDAIARGLDPGLLESNPAFALFRGRPDFESLLSRPVGNKSPARTDLLVDPLR